MSSHLKAELAVTCSTLGRFHKGEYIIEPGCIESVKDLIRYLKRDDDTHEIRRYLGEAKVLQNDLIHIIKACTSEMDDLFDVTLRLLINLTTPTMLFYGEEIPSEKVARNIYLSLIDYGQAYKCAFSDVDFWNKMCTKLTNLFEIDWAERSADDGIQIERILMLLRNVLQVPADFESEKRPENDITVHDKVLWALRQSQILELLLFVSSNTNEEQYYLNLLEIFSLILREQNPKLLAQCDIERSAAEKNRDTDDLIKVREFEKRSQNKYLNARNFNATYVMKGVKSFSNNDVVCHKSLDKVNVLSVNNPSKKQVRLHRNKVPVESERVERRSTFSVRLFLKEFSLEFLNSAFSHLMSVVKNRLDSGKSLVHDESYYFWAIKFFLDFAVASNSDVDLIKGCLPTEIFHFVQTSMDNAFEHLTAEKKKTVDWVKRIHLILKAYHSLLETLFWMDCSKNPLVRALSREIKSEIFYVVEYREMTLHMLLRYDHTKFSVSYLRDVIETTHLFIKLLEEFSKQKQLVVQKIARKRASNKKKKKDEVEAPIETNEEKWEKIKDDVYDTLSSESTFPEISPFDAALEIPIDDQKGRAMKKIQKFLHDGRLKEAIGLLRSARQVWPENDYFGCEGMTVEDETMALQEICHADLSEVEGDIQEKETPPVEIEEKDNEGEQEDEEEEEEEEERTHIVEHNFDIMDYKKRLVNKKVVEGCGVLLRNYSRNSSHANHCAIKLLHRIGWECCMPAMLYQASLFWTLLKIMKDKRNNYDEINTFTMNLVRRFRKHASKNPVVFLELLFWKEHNVALEIQHGYEPYEEKKKPKAKRSKKKKSKKGFDNFESEEEGEEDEISQSRIEIDKPDGMEVENLESVRDNSKKSRKKNKDGEKKPRRSRKKKTDKPMDIDIEDLNDMNPRNENLLTKSSMTLNTTADGVGEDTLSTPGEEPKKNAVEDDSDEDLPGRNLTSKNIRKNLMFNSSDEDDEKEEDGGNNTSMKVTENSEDEFEKEGKKENEGIGRSQNDKFEELKRQENPPDDLENGDRSNSPSSNASSKKRGREETDNEILGDDSDGSDVSKWKRRRYIGSDSDLENEFEEERSPVVAKKNRKRLVVIDSDSDVEENLLNDDDIRSK